MKTRANSRESTRNHKAERLMEETGYSFKECKDAVTKTNGDLYLAEGYLHYSNQKMDVKYPNETPENSKKRWVWWMSKLWRRKKLDNNG